MKLYVVRWDNNEQENSGIPSVGAAIVWAPSVVDAIEAVEEAGVYKVYETSLRHEDTALTKVVFHTTQGE